MSLFKFFTRKLKMNTSQAEMILSHLKHKPISDTVAREEYGCRRLASRINDLRNNGYSIETVTKKTVNRFGRKCTYAEYYLKNDG